MTNQIKNLEKISKEEFVKVLNKTVFLTETISKINEKWKKIYKEALEFKNEYEKDVEECPRIDHFVENVPGKIIGNCSLYYELWEKRRNLDCVLASAEYPYKSIIEKKVNLYQD